jgi:type 1 glutamine amidotransferase
MHLKTQEMGKVLSRIGKALVFTISLTTSATSISQQLPKALLLTGNGNVPKVKDGYPPWIHEFHNQMISDILQDIVVAKVTSDLRELNSKSLSEYDMIISYSLFLTPNTEQLDALYRFISEGKSLLTIHCGILSFLNWKRYEEVMGGIFIGGPSSEPDSFNVSTTNMEFWGYDYAFRNSEEHPVSKVVNDFIIKDELYYFQPSKSEFFVLARAENHPVMWWHPVGKGKVMCFTLGHSEKTKQNDGYQQLLKNGVRWLMGYPLIESVRQRPLSTRSKIYSPFLQMPGITYASDKPSLKYAAEGNDQITLNCNQAGNIDVELSGKTGTSTVSISATNEVGLTTQKEVEITVIEDGEANIASYYGNKATASSTENQNSLFDVAHAIDGDLTTRWSSDFVDPSWIQIDLQKIYTAGRIVLHWETSFASNYTVQISETGTSWKTVADVNGGDGKTDEITFAQESARFIKVTGTKRALKNYGHSLYEVEVYKR